MDPYTIVIADDHAFTVEGMAAMLGARDTFEIVGRAANGIDAIALIKRLKPDCALLDLAMPGANGLETFLEARRWSPGTRFAVITGNPSAAIFAQFVEAGINGLFLKTAPPERICDGIEAVCRGETVFSEEVAGLLPQTDATANLTAREIEVLQQIARGQSNSQIGARLGVSPKTVDSHRTNLMRKLGVHSTATLLVKAMKDGLIDVTGQD